LTPTAESATIKEKECLMNRGQDDAYIQRTLERGAAYVNRAFISYAPESASKEQVEYTCEIIAEYIKEAYNEEAYE
jgi:hypothetical protein